MRVRAIRTESDHRAALERIDALMGATSGSPEGDELDVLVDLVEHYEEKHVPMGFPSPVAAIEFRMEQEDLAPRDLVPLIGSRAKVSEVLSGKRPLTMRMARALHEHLGIPADVLLQQAEDPAALYRKSDRTNAKSDPRGLEAWCWQVLATAREDRPRKAYVRGTVKPKFLREIARLSAEEDGPLQAARLLAKHGIPLVIVRHLKRTYLDGAALKLADGRPVVALTLRYDRIDNFWFCLLHELAHVGRHLDAGDDTVFIDDLNLQSADVKESEADEWALEALIPRDQWEGSAVRERPTPMAVVQFANKLHIHPAIVAGRVRFERRNFRMLSHYVGNGEVRKHFRL